MICLYYNLYRHHPFVLLVLVVLFIIGVLISLVSGKPLFRVGDNRIGLVQEKVIRRVFSPEKVWFISIY